MKGISVNQIEGLDEVLETSKTLNVFREILLKEDYTDNMISIGINANLLKLIEKRGISVTVHYVPKGNVDVLYPIRYNSIKINPSLGINIFIDQFLRPGKLLVNVRI